MSAIEILKPERWSYSFLLPLTGLHRAREVEWESYLHWEGNHVEDYRLVVKVSYKEKRAYQDGVLPQLSNVKGLLELYEWEDMTVMIFDLSSWHGDVITFLKGRYSQMSEEAKEAIQAFHQFEENGKLVMNVRIYCYLYPTKEHPFLGGMSPLQYAAEQYGLDLEELERIGELGSLYDLKAETLILNRQLDTVKSLE